MVLESRELRVSQPGVDKLDARIARAAAGQWGVLDLDELLACGLTRQAVSKRIATGRLFPFHRGVYAVGHPNLPLEGCFLAAVKACGPDAVLSHFSAGPPARSGASSHGTTASRR
jgi:hypothetical protein